MLINIISKLVYLFWKLIYWIENTYNKFRLLLVDIKIIMFYNRIKRKGIFDGKEELN